MTRELDERQAAIDIAHRRISKPVPLQRPRPKRRTKLQRMWRAVKSFFFRRKP